jgi:hypothetical protein
MITIERWRRLLDGELYAPSSRVEWAEPGTVKKILAHLGLPTEPLPRARARDPTGQENFDFDAA